MDLLKTILLYMTMIYASSVQNAPEPTPAPAVTPAPAPVVAETRLVSTPTATMAATPTPTSVPTPDITPNSEYNTVRVGDNGEEVKQMQRRLADLGYYTGDIDGRFGNQTRRAVERFQYNNGLSADGIAGKNTLTVLFESKTVVAFTATEATPTPTANPGTQGPTTAQTAKPDAATPPPTFVPTVTPTPTASPETVGTVLTTEPPSAPAGVGIGPHALMEEETTQPPAEEKTTQPPTETTPSAGPTLLPLTDAGFVLEGETERMTRTAEDSAEPTPLVPLEKDGETVFVPFLKILEECGVVLVPSVTEQRAEYAFAILGDVYHLTVDMDENGVPKDVAITKNGIPQIMGERTALLEDGMLYLPLAEMEKWTGTVFALDEETQTYTVTLPTEAD